MATVIDIRTRQRFETTPDFVDFICDKVGTDRWYTAKRPSPKTMSRRHYVSPKTYNAIEAEYEALYGSHFQ